MILDHILELGNPESLNKELLHRTSMSLSLQVSAECEIPQVIRRKRNSLQTSIPQTSTPVITTTAFTDVDIALDPLTNAMAGQLSCLEDLEMLLDSLPDEMCFLSKNHVGSSRNDHCWTGTSLGRYIATVCAILVLIAKYSEPGPSRTTSGGRGGSAQ